MKKTVVREVSVKICDACGAEEGKCDYFSECIRCGKHYCYQCRKRWVIEYKPGVYHSGTFDGSYCVDCDRAAFSEGDALNLAYREIMALREAADLQRTMFAARVDEAEARLTSHAEQSHPDGKARRPRQQ
jgi:hypothetical protein